MANVPYRHGPGPEFLTLERAQRIHQTALRILQDVGLEVDSDSVRAGLAARGLRVAGDRVYLEPPVVESYLAEVRRRREAESERQPDPPPDDGRLHLSVGVYAHHVHDLQADRIVPYTTEALIEMTKLVDVLTERGLSDASPGYPLDVPPIMQPIVQYWVGACYSRHGEWPVDPISDASMPYIMEMAEVMGHPIRSLPVYVFSPLRLAGESLHAVMHYRDRLDAIHVSAMPSLGGSAPVLPFGALALAAAEVIGAAVVLAELTHLRVDFGTGLHAFDLHSGSMIFGSPEAYLYGLISNDMSAYYSVWRRRRAAIGTGIHSRANFPGAQAAAEKATLMAASALAGARWFGGAGILSVDEVFSAEQLLVDLEIRDGVERLLRGLDMDEEGYDWVEEVRQGVEGTFMGVRSTVDHHRQAYWYPQLFDRGFLAGQGPDGRLKLAERARDMVREVVARHNFELDPLRRRKLERVVERAKREL